MQSANLDPTEAMRAVGHEVVKLCGYLPLYVGLIARLIYEYGDDVSWQTEVLELLHHGGNAVFGDARGEQIVGGSLAAVQDPTARELFAALAMAP